MEKIKKKEAMVRELEYLSDATLLQEIETYMECLTSLSHNEREIRTIKCKRNLYLCLTRVLGEQILARVYELEDRHCLFGEQYIKE